LFIYAKIRFIIITFFDHLSRDILEKILGLFEEIGEGQPRPPGRDNPENEPMMSTGLLPPLKSEPTHRRKANPLNRKIILAGCFWKTDPPPSLFSQKYRIVKSRQIVKMA